MACATYQVDWHDCLIARVDAGIPDGTVMIDRFYVSGDTVLSGDPRPLNLFARTASDPTVWYEGEEGNGGRFWIAFKANHPGQPVELWRSEVSPTAWPPRFSRVKNIGGSVIAPTMMADEHGSHVLTGTLP